jgi:xylan 1,4-beta-xylosidase
VGGPATAKNAWIPEFLEFCKKRNVPVDFVSTHHYPTDAFGKAGANTRSQLQHAPPHGMRDDVRTVRGQAKGLPVYYTEWNISSNPRDALHDQPFAATYATKIVLEAQGLVEGYSFWTFSDIFNENYFPSVPFQGGFGLLNIHGIPKPIYRAFELLHRLGSETFDVQGNHETVDAWFVRRQTAATMLLTNHAMPRCSIRKQRVNVWLKDAQRPRRVYAERIDEQHANARKFWESLGSPDYLSAAQIEKLMVASQLVKEEQRWQCEDGNVGCTIIIPPHGMAALTFEFA